MSRPLAKREQNRQERERAILAAAMRVFADSGFAGASMDVIAADAGISKPTLYQYFSSKEDLFTTVLQQERDHMLEVFEHPSERGLVADLHAFAWDYARTVMRKDMLSLSRLIIAEAQRRPEIGSAFQASGPDRVLAGMMAYLSVQRDRGLLVFDDPELAAEDLWGLVLSAPRNRALHEPDTPVDDNILARYINNGLRVYIRAYSTNIEPDLSALEALSTPPANGTERT